MLKRPATSVPTVHIQIRIMLLENVALRCIAGMVYTMSCVSSVANGA